MTSLPPTYLTSSLHPSLHPSLPPTFPPFLQSFPPSSLPPSIPSSFSIHPSITFSFSFIVSHHFLSQSWLYTSHSTSLLPLSRRISSRSRKNGWLSEPHCNSEYLPSDIVRCQLSTLVETYSQRFKAVQRPNIIIGWVCCV